MIISPHSYTSYYPGFVNTVVNKTILAITSFITYFFKTLSSNFPIVYKFPSQMMFHSLSFLFSWKWQAIYLRGAIWYQTLIHYIKGYEAHLIKHRQENLINSQHEELSDLSTKLEAAALTIRLLKQKNVKTSKENQQLTLENTALKKALEEQQLGSILLSVKQDIATQEKMLVDLIQSIYIRYQSISESHTSLILSSHKHLIDVLIPSWQTHCEAHCRMMEDVIAATPETLTHKTLMIKLHELAKRPLIFTQILAKFCLILTPQIPKVPVDELTSPADPDPENLAFIKAMAALEQELSH